MRNFALIMIVALSIVVSGCGNEKPPQQNEAVSQDIDLSTAKDGTYTVDSSRDDKLGYSTLTLTIENHKITQAEFTGIDLFGNVKNEDYGSLISGKDSADYKKAQIAVKANSEYAKQLVNQQSLEKVDAISGATISYNQFTETVKKAVDEAAK